MKSQAYGLKGDKENQIENGHCACEKKFRNHLSSLCVLQTILKLSFVSMFLAKFGKL